MNDRTPSGFSNPAPAENGPADVEAATRRLAAALDLLEAAVERRREVDRNEDQLAARIQSLGTDRARLANELDGSLVRSRALETANRDIAQRLDVAIDTIKSVIDGSEPS